MINTKYAQALENAAHLLCAAAGMEKLDDHVAAVRIAKDARGLIAFADDILAKNSGCES